MDSAFDTPHWSQLTTLGSSPVGDLALAAIQLAHLGFAVFPCVPGGKRPLTSRGFHDASADARQVRQWWRRNPDANIGLPTGHRSSVVVVDVDVHGDASGFPAFERARKIGLTDAWSWLVRTPSGGLHAYFPATNRLEQRSWQAPEQHIDFRGDGGYVIAPPSRILVAGVLRTYDVIAIAQHVPHPLDAAGLRQFLDPPRPGPPPRSMPVLGPRPDRLAAWVAGRPEGARNNGLFWATCRMAEGGHPYDATLALLSAAASQAGLPEREAETTIRSAYRIASRPSPRTSPSPTHTPEGIRL